MDIKQVDVIKKDGNLYGFRYNKAVVYAVGDDIHQAFINAWESLEYESKLDTPSITSDDGAIEVYTPQPSKAVSLDFYSDYHTVVLKEPVTVNFKAKAYDQYGQELDVKYNKTATIKTVGKHKFIATCGDLNKTIEIEALEYTEPVHEPTEIEKMRNDLDNAVMELSLAIAMGGM